jgi:hypothetical protein
MMTTNTGIRTLSGVRFLIHEITKLVETSTAVVANPIDMPLMADVVVARVGHIPRRSTNAGFSLIIPFVKILI